MVFRWVCSRKGGGKERIEDGGTASRLVPEPGVMPQITDTSMQPKFANAFTVNSLGRQVNLLQAADA